ncbi:MAG: 1,4-dihydroxy-2-naphthoate octaprenyltransferase, partial [Nitrospirae bacterium]|nr:1,4-dihydroxy-2-naphthoate octaprenyltransferase [Nitrospirota bacterium]
MRPIALWLRAMRVPFLQASLIPAALGSALAYRDGTFFWGLFWIIAVAIAAINVGANFSNDYFDHRSGADERNPRPTLFSGGSRVIQDGHISPEAVLIAAMLSYSLAVALGLYLILRSDWKLLLFGLPGILLSFFYTAPPLKLGYRGWGEPLVGILLGPLAVMGSYYVYSLTLTVPVFFLSLPIGFLVAGILYINQFPDAESDAAAGKRHWIVRMGRKRAVKGYFAILVAAYLGIVLPVAFGILPVWTLLALASLPLAVWAGRILYRSYDQPQRL